MMSDNILITVGSWEERFLKGNISTLNSRSVDSLIILNNKANPYLEETNINIGKLRLETSDSIAIKCCEFEFNSTMEIWKHLTILFEEISKIDYENKSFIFDVTTAPREIIWYVLFFLSKKINRISYVYYKPNSYPSDWLTRDPRKPRFILKHSGISEFGKPTGLFIATGFDPYRTHQLINYYEPKFILLAFQPKNDLDTDNHSESLHQSLVSKYKNSIEVFEVDCYNSNEAFATIEEKLETHLPNYNFIMSSLGPKLSAITLYRVFLSHPEIALTYARSNDYNLNYSEGIGAEYFGELVFTDSLKSVGTV